MTDYELHISSYKGVVPGAKHFRGRVTGPHPVSCHGGTVFNAPEHRGVTTCQQGHVLPERDEWDVEAAWTEERFNRWDARHFEGDGPGQFLTEARVILAARRRFLGLDPVQWWEHPGVVAGQPGDRLLFDGEVVAARPPAEGTETGQETAARRREAAARAERIALLELADRYPYLDWDWLKPGEAAS